jgi:hypothetical protein
MFNSVTSSQDKFGKRQATPGLHHPVKPKLSQKLLHGHTLLFESAITILEGNTSAFAILQLFEEMLICYRNSTIPQSQFFLKSATSSLQLEIFTSAFSAYFWLWNPVD